MMNATEEYNQKLRDGWVLYYSEEGYPYYYREETGESEWAQTYDGSIQSGENAVKEGNNSEEESAGSDTASDDSDDESDEESESDETEGSKSSGGQPRTVDKELEARFLEFLKTPEGIAAAEAELQRIGRKVEKRQARRAKEVDKDYVRNLATKKKDQVDAKHAYSLAGVAGLLSDTATSWMFPAKPRKATRETPKGASGGKDKPASAIKQDDHIRDAKQRHRQPKGADGDVYDGVESGFPARSGSPISSRSSSISSETDSFSSDDSDVAQIDAPLWAELPAWTSLTSLTARWFPAPGSGDGDRPIAQEEERPAGTEPPSTSSAALVPFLPAVMLDAAQLQTVSADLASRGFQYVGGAFVQAFGLLFERLNPLLEEFVTSIIDTQLAPANSLTTAPSARSRATRSDDVQSRDFSSSSRVTDRVQHEKAGRAEKSSTSTPRAPAVLSARSGVPPPYPAAASRSMRSTPRLPASPRTASSVVVVPQKAGHNTVTPAVHNAEGSSQPAGLCAKPDAVTETEPLATGEAGSEVVPELNGGDERVSQAEENAKNSLQPVSARPDQRAAADVAAPAAAVGALASEEVGSGDALELNADEERAMGELLSAERSPQSAENPRAEPGVVPEAAAEAGFLAADVLSSGDEPDLEVSGQPVRGADGSSRSEGGPRAEPDTGADVSSTELADDDVGGEDELNTKAGDEQVSLMEQNAERSPSPSSPHADDSPSLDRTNTESAAIVEKSIGQEDGSFS